MFLFLVGKLDTTFGQIFRYVPGEIRGFPIGFSWPVTKASQALLDMIGLLLLDRESETLEEQQQRGGREKEEMPIFAPGRRMLQFVKRDKITTISEAIGNGEEEHAIGLHYPFHFFQKGHGVQYMFEYIVDVDVVKKCLGEMRVHQVTLRDIQP